MVIGVHFVTEITKYFFLPTPSQISAAGRKELHKTGLFWNSLTTMELILV
jgi:ABC-type nitrate/sulfonate/bicarbonate transport system permease component